MLYAHFSVNMVVYIVNNNSNSDGNSKSKNLIFKLYKSDSNQYCMCIYLKVATSNIIFVYVF